MGLGAYRPVPTIVQAAEALFAGHQVTEIAAAATDPKNPKETSEALVAIIETARSNKEYVIAFVTGVPGSGKTLVGLNAVHDKRFSLGGASPGAYLSGNTPLVEVLKMALAEDARKREGIPATEAARRVGAAVQTLMNFLREYLNAHPDKPPPTMLSYLTRLNGPGMRNTENRNLTGPSQRRLSFLRSWVVTKTGR